jgi:uncharacterized protein (TIGR00725 family)
VTISHMRRPVVGVMGAGEPSPECQAAARELGRLIAQQGWILLTGGRPAGVMAAASAGAKEVPGSLTLGILPGASGGTDPHVDVAVYTGMGDGRNVINVLTSDVVVACGAEGPGTVSEIGLALKSKKTVILLGASAPARAFFTALRTEGRLLEASSANEAIRLIEEELRTRPGPE